MKKFLLWVMVICMLMTMGMANVTAFADGTNGTDQYYLQPENWPNKHWALMDDEEVAAIEEAGWIREEGVLWAYFDGTSWTYTSEVEDANASEVQDLYNKGYQFSVLYTWVCPAEFLGTASEQSVSVGQWVMSPEEATEYLKTYQIPEYPVGSISYSTFDSEWYNGDGISADMTGNESEEELKKFTLVRYIYNTYDYGYGSKLFIRNGEAEVYTYEEACVVNESTGFFNEMPKWH